MPPNTKKCERCGIENPPETRWTSPLCETRDGNIRTRHETHILTPSPEKCLHIKALNESGIKIPEGYICRACTPSTPAVEDWEEKLKVMILSRGMGVSLNDCVNYVRSLRESDRKRILKWAEKEKRHDILYFSDLVAFITNLK